MPLAMPKGMKRDFTELPHQLNCVADDIGNEMWFYTRWTHRSCDSEHCNTDRKVSL